MRRATLLFNPAAGRARKRSERVHAAAEVLRAAGVAVEIEATRARGSAGGQVRDAVRRGSDVVFACGGDGTVHEVVQGLAGCGNAALGVIPLGSANVLARHLGLPLEAAEAARTQLAWEPRCVPVGRVAWQQDGQAAERFFLVMAGAGPDGALVYRMLAAGKQRLGRLSYYVRAARLFARGEVRRDPAARFDAFPVVCELEDGSVVERRVVSAMAVRVADLGGLFTPLASGDLLAPALHLTLVHAPAVVGLPLWFGLSWARLGRLNRFAETLAVRGFRCGAGEHVPVQVQADGEWLGRTPMQVELVREGTRLLMPPQR